MRGAFGIGQNDMGLGAAFCYDMIASGQERVSLRMLLTGIFVFI